MRQFDAQAKEEFSNLFEVDPLAQFFRHGQIKRAASFAIRNFGHEWPLRLKRDDVERLCEEIKFRRQLGAVILKSTSPWHSNPSVVKRRFFDYSNKLASRIEALKVMKKMRDSSAA